MTIMPCVAIWDDEPESIKDPNDPQYETYAEIMVSTYVPNNIGMKFSDALALANERDAEAAENIVLSTWDEFEQQTSNNLLSSIVS